MREKKSDINRLLRFIDNLDMTLNLLGLSRLSSIFPADGELSDLEIKDDGQIVLRYPGKEKEQGGTGLPHYGWFIVDSLVIRSEDVPYWVKESSPNPYTVLLMKDAPFYIEVFYRVISKYYQKSLVYFDDDLPHYLGITIDTKFNLKTERKGILRRLAKSYGLKDAVLDAIVERKDLTFKQSIDEIIKLSGSQVQADFSYCLACGNKIERGNKFCDATTRRYKNKDHCRNMFRYWLKSRLGITDIKEHTKLREKYFKELQSLIAVYPLSAFEDFKKRYPELYDRRYEERWERWRKKRKSKK